MKRLRLHRLPLMLIPTLFAFSSAVRGQEGSRARQTVSSPPSPTMRALRAEAGKPSLYEVRFVTTDTLEAKAELEFEFPAALDLRQLEVASSTSINGGFTLVRERNIVRVRRTGLGAVVPPGSSVELQLGLITNPTPLPASLEVSFTQLRASGQAATSKRSYPVQFSTAKNQ